MTSTIFLGFVPENHDHLGLRLSDVRGNALQRRWIASDELRLRLQNTDRPNDASQIQRQATGEGHELPAASLWIEGIEIAFISQDLAK